MLVLGNSGSMIVNGGGLEDYLRGTFMTATFLVTVGLSA